MFALDDLNPAQREAALAISGPVLILAGAGSGKTRVLTYRIAHLVAEGKARADRILAVTFTNKAANEMRERVEKLVGGRLGLPPWIGTFHSICARILRREAPRIGYQSSFVIFDQDDSLALIRKLLRELNPVGAPSPEVLRAQIENAKHEAMTPDEMALVVRNTPREVAAQLYRAYQEQLKKLNAMDFGDLPMLTARLFAEQPEALSRWQEQFDYILVDEYQDTDRAQYSLLRALAARHENISVVGDEDQSIYRWRGADIRNILDFERDFPNARVFKLEQNYRSTATILEAAQSVIRNNQQRKSKRLWTHNERGEPVVCYAASSERDEADFIARELRRLIDRGQIEPAEAVVFYRTNAQSRPIEEALIRRRIPYAVVGGMRFYERREVKDLVAYLRVLANPADSVSLERALAAPKKGIGAKTLESLAEFASREEIDLFEALGRAEAAFNLPLRIAKPVREFYEWLSALRLRAAQLSVRAIIEEIITRVDFLGYLETLGNVEARRESVEQLLASASQFDSEHPPGALGEFLEAVALYSEADHQVSNAVTLMTLHTSKGLEYPAVFIAGMEEGLFPHARSQQSEAEIEEERRLFYVGMTRAQRLLYLTHARSRELHGRRDEARPSRFLAEIDPTLVKRVDALAEPFIVVPADPPERGEGSSYYVDYSDSQIPEHDDETWRSATGLAAVGSRVFHPTFGPGTVRRQEGRGDMVKAWVEFDRGGLKLLALKYANLRPIP